MVRINELAISPLWNLLGIEAVYGDDGEVTLKLPVTPKLLQFYGKVHGGVIATLIDAAASVAINLKLPPDRGATTVDININYLRPVEKGILYAKGQVISLGNKLLVGSADVLDDQGCHIAHGTGTYYKVSVNK